MSELPRVKRKKFSIAELLNAFLFQDKEPLKCYTCNSEIADDEECVRYQMTGCKDKFQCMPCAPKMFKDKNYKGW